jgi:hypothetical protein
MGIALVSGTIVATQGVPSSQAGLASGLLNASRLVGGALGLAVLSTLAADHTRGEGPVADPLRALTEGFTLAFTVGVFICVAGAAAAAVLMRAPSALPTPEVEPSAA